MSDEHSLAPLRVPLPAPLLDVSEAEAGQKLLQFLARRVDAPDAALHRWIRTGQVRVNGGRAKAFDRVAASDKVRVPPFALPGARIVGFVAPRDELLLEIVLENSSVLICEKPAGLPVHAGTGHADSLIARLHARYVGSDFMPTPAHRLDKATSGLILLAKTYAALRLAQEALAGGGIVKTYLAWVRGSCPWQEPARLEDKLEKARDADGLERVRVTDTGRNSVLTAQCLEWRRDASLLRLTLHTGRTHQIRAQLAARAFPLIGDPKYGGPPCDQGLLLHANSLDFASDVAAGFGLVEHTIVRPPLWRGKWAV